MSFLGKWALVVLLASGDTVILPLPYTETDRADCERAAAPVVAHLNEPVLAVACVERA